MAKKPSAPNKAFVRKDPDAWKRYGWTSIPNSILQAPDIPPEEGWAWGWMASHTQTFEISAEKLWHANEHVSKHKAYALMHNLEERGLLLRTHEATADGVPYIVYDLQPWPVPQEQRTHKPRKPKPKKPFPQERAKTTNAQADPDSRPSGNPGMTRNNALRDDIPDEDPGFPDGRESGDDQEQRADPVELSEQRPGGVSPDRVSPDRSGESYKEEKTNGKDQPTKGTTDEPSGASPEDREVGWLDSKKKIPDTAGARYLQNLAFPSGQGFGAAAIRALHEHTTALLASGWTEQGITGEITNADGAGKVNSWPGFARPKLEALRPLPADAGKSGTKTGVDLPPWCGECGDPSDPRRELKCTNNVRTRVWPDGTPCSCRTADVSAA